MSLGCVTMYRLTGLSCCIKSRMQNCEQRRLCATTGSRYSARYDFAVDSTEPASSAGRSSMSRPADATTGWTWPPTCWQLVISAHSSAASRWGSASMASTPDSVARPPSARAWYSACRITPTSKAWLVFCQWFSRPLPSGSTIKVARFCTSPTSCSGVRRISSRGFQHRPACRAAGSKRMTLLWACFCRQPAVMAHSSPLRSVTTVLCGHDSSVGTTSPTPLPERVGA
ncbi:hypothetical protein D3C71_1479230 [compost metagenome]